MGGVTFSILSRWLSCRDRAKVKLIHGLGPRPRFSKHMEYGNMFHLCEESLLAGRDWRQQLISYTHKLLAKYSSDREEIEKWYCVCLLQFPEYVKFWNEPRPEPGRVITTTEKPFSHVHKLPSGRQVMLRGKKDSTYKVKTRGIIGVRENKTKGDVDIVALQKQLTYDLQSMIYALVEGANEVEYNVIRRPLSGGKGNLTRSEGTKGAKCTRCKGVAGNLSCPRCGGLGRVGGKPPETEDAYYDRVAQYIHDDPAHYFARWATPITPDDIEAFCTHTLDPILENLCAWYDAITRKPNQKPLPSWALSWRHPYGAANRVDDYGMTDVDEFLTSGSTVGLQRLDDLFGELR